MSTRRSNVNIAKSKLGNRERQSPRRTKTPSSNEVKNKFKFSPKGKRKLDFPFKGKRPGPLAGKLFYLDLNGSRYLNQLKKTIGQLGGTIEEFFRKEVTYLVTSRGECGKSPSSQSMPSPGTPSPIPQTRSSSMKNYATASPMSADSPQGVDTQNQVSSGTMRGKSIAQRSAGLKKGSTDILTIASTWGVNILHVDHVMNWISQLMLKTKQQRMTKEKTSPSKRVFQTRHPKVAPLKETYIKVEDLGFKYRPIFHEFKLWPEITFFGSNVCPFDPPRGRSSESTYSITKRKSGEGNVKKLPIHERPKHGYCECCEVRYNDLDTHLRGKQHKEFARKSLNYTSLDKAINEGLKIESLLEEIRLKKLRSLSNIDPVRKQSSLTTSCEDTGDLLDDDIFLLSSPRVLRRNRNNLPNLKPKENLNNEENLNNVEKCENMALMEDVVVGQGGIQETAYVPIRCSPTKRVKSAVPPSSTDAKESESQESRPVTRSRKASNLSSPCEGKNIELASRKPDRSPNKLKNTVEYQKQSKNYIGGSKRKSTEVIEELDKFENLECSNRSLGNSNAVLEEKNERMVENENIISPRRSSRTRKPNLNSSNVRDKENDSKAEVYLAQKEENGEIEWKNRLRNQKNNRDMCSSGLTLTKTSNQNSNTANKCKYSTSNKDGKRERSNKAIGCDVRDTDEDQQDSKDSPRLKTPTKKTSNNNNFAMCPGALIQEESVTLRSARRRQSVVGDCKLSPISPCNLDGDYSVLSSCSEDIEFLPSGLRVYSSFGSSLGDVYKDINHIVDRMGDDENEDVFTPKSDTTTGCSEIACNVGVSNSLTKDQVNGSEIQVSLTFMNVHAMSVGCGSKDEGSTSATAKRKRIQNEEESHTGRKCKRLSVASDGEQVTQVENGLTSGIGVNDSFRSSVAERVKLHRAISESLQECGLFGLSDGNSPIRPTGRKRMNALQSSPFVEITNTGKKRKERAKSEGRIRTSACSILKRNKNGRSQPLSACLTPNDPFSFDDY